MSAASYFEDFSTGVSAIATGQSGSSDQLASYETGFQAGWDDAIAANQKSNSHVSASLARNLEAIDFTMAEAQAQILAGLKPILDEIGETLLPGITQTALRSHITKEVTELLRIHSPSQIMLCVSDADKSSIDTLLLDAPETKQISVEIKDTLGEGQAYVRCAQLERKIDISQSIQDIRASIDAFVSPQEQEQAHVG